MCPSLYSLNACTHTIASAVSGRSEVSALEAGWLRPKPLPSFPPLPPFPPSPPVSPRLPPSLRCHPFSTLLHPSPPFSNLLHPPIPPVPPFPPSPLSCTPTRSPARGPARPPTRPPAHAHTHHTHAPHPSFQPASEKPRHPSSELLGPGRAHIPQALEVNMQVLIAQTQRVHLLSEMARGSRPRPTRTASSRTGRDNGPGRGGRQATARLLHQNRG